MKITKRGTNVKRHTTHYLVGNRWMTRKETVALAEKGKISGVAVYRRGDRKYIQSCPSSDARLSDLPTMVKA